MNKKYIIKKGKSKRMIEAVKYKIKKQILKFEIGRKIYKIHVERPFKKDQRKRRRLSSKKKFNSLKNICKGKRCFIIGNGPSLTIDDLNCLKNEDTFGVNRIFKIFNQTDWRPTYYCTQDSRMLEEIYKDLEPLCDICKYVILNSSVKRLMNGLERENLFYLFLNIKPYNNQLPEFSEDICEGVIEGSTVTYACIQLAVYMGYTEIYLLGIDHNYSFTACEDGSATQDDPSKNYMKGLEGNLVFAPQLDKSTLAYRKAALVCKKKNVVIKNATRGGKLEEFERVNFDDLFHNS